MTSALARGAPTLNSMFLKPMLRKSSYHKKAGGADNMLRETVKTNAEEGTMMKNIMNEGENERNCCCWVPHDRTGIYYPKGQEKIMEDVPPAAGKHIAPLNWFSENYK